MAAPLQSSTPAHSSTLASLLSLNARERKTLLSSLSEREAEALLYDWRLWARPLASRSDGSWGGQLAPPGDWRIWLLLAGRGYGKTRTAGEFVRAEVEAGRAGHIGLVGENAADVRDVMIEGESGLLAISPPWFMPKYEPSKRRLTWPNGARATTFSGDAPDQLRGPQHDLAWADEPAKWKYPQEAWDNLEFGLRLGAHPRAVASTTPRPIPLIKSLVADADTVVTRGSLYENVANLSAKFVRRMRRKYEGTRLGRQELHAEILDDNPHALWNRAQLDAQRVSALPELARIVVGVDPPAGGQDEDTAAECGIVVAGVGASDGHGYVLDDCSLRGSPAEWGAAVVAAYHKWRANLVVGEVNQGGDMVKFVVSQAAIASGDYALPFKAVRATRGKALRAEPIAAIYEQRRGHHVGHYGLLEDQQCDWQPSGQSGQKSPDRLDALVWALTELMLADEDDTPAAGPPIILSGRRG